jgi:hypothetical protein
MTFNETMEWQRIQSDKIKRLAKFGDKLAKRLIDSYRILYADRLNPLKQQEWMKICDDYCRRDLTITTRALLGERFGHKIPQQLRRIDS